MILVLPVLVTIRNHETGPFQAAERRNGPGGFFSSRFVQIHYVWIAYRRRKQRIGNRRKHILIPFFILLNAAKARC